MPFRAFHLPHALQTGAALLAVLSIAACAGPLSPTVPPAQPVTPTAAPSPTFAAVPSSTPAAVPSETPAAAPSPTAGAAPAPTEPNVISGRAMVKDIEIIMLESFPVQVQVVISGNLPDGCTRIDQIEQARLGNTFQVTVTTRRPADAMCTQALVPFQERVPLDVKGLPAGTYTIDVNGVTDTFTLTSNNPSNRASIETRWHLWNESGNIAENPTA